MAWRCEAPCTTAPAFVRELTPGGGAWRTTLVLVEHPRPGRQTGAGGLKLHGLTARPVLAGGGHEEHGLGATECDPCSTTWLRGCSLLIPSRGAGPRCRCSPCRAFSGPPGQEVVEDEQQYCHIVQSSGSGR